MSVTDKLFEFLRFSKPRTEFELLETESGEPLFGYLPEWR